MRKQKIELKWSKRKKDWEFHWSDNSGKSMMGVFFDMIKVNGHRMDWEEDLEKMLTERGYDYKSLKISCNKLTPTTHETTD